MGTSHRCQPYDHPEHCCGPALDRCPRPAPNVSAEEKEIDDLLDTGHAVGLLSESHCVAGNDSFGIHDDLGDGLDLLSGMPRLLDDSRPVSAPQIGEKRGQTAGMLRDEVVTNESPWMQVIGVHNFLHNAVE